MAESILFSTAFKHSYPRARISLTRTRIHKSTHYLEVLYDRLPIILVKFLRFYFSPMLTDAVFG